MTLQFDEKTHSYTKDGNKYISVTTLIDKVTNDFNADEVIDEMLKGQELYLGAKSELLGLNKEQIKALWELNRIGKSNYGSYIHNYAEKIALDIKKNKLPDCFKPERPEFKQVYKFFKNEGYKIVEAEKIL